MRKFVSAALQSVDNDLAQTLTELSKPEGISYFRSLVSFSPAFSLQASTPPKNVSFQRIVVPLVRFLSLPSVSHSTLTSQVNAIYATINQPEFLSALARCLPLPTGPLGTTVHDYAPKESDVVWEPEDWKQVLGPITCFLRLVLTKDHATKFNQSAAALADALISGANDWARATGEGIPRELREDLNAVSLLIGEARKHREREAKRTEQREREDRMVGLFGRGGGFFNRRNEDGTEALDGPGELSLRGEGRHDNDHVDYRAIRVGPTQGEVLSPHMPYLPKPGGAHHLPPDLRVDRHLDVQFRLLRHDILAPLLNSATALIQAGPGLGELPGGRFSAKNGERDSVDLFVFSHVQVQDLSASASNRGGDFFYTIEFDQRCTRNSQKGKKKERMDDLKRYWTNTRHLLHGSLVCLWVTRPDSPNEADRLQLVFATVSEREVEMRLANRNGRCLPNLVHSVDRAQIGIVPCGDDDHETLCNLMLSGRAGPGKISMVEASASFFAYSPVLTALQKLGDGTLPLSKYLVGSGTIQPAPPAYIHDDTVFDLSSLVEPGTNQITVDRLRNVRVGQEGEFPLVELREATTLDRGQAEAVKMALTREFALIQGPPGTGKTYVGVKIVQLFLRNCITGGTNTNMEWVRRPNNTKPQIGPIVCVCLTNHALDQFLLALMDSGVKGIVRIGGRSKSDRVELANCNLINLVKGSNQRTKTQRYLLAKAHERLEAQQRVVEKIKTALRDTSTRPRLKWADVENVVAVNFPEIYDEITRGGDIWADDRIDLDEEKAEEGGSFEHVGSRRDPMEDWLRRGQAGGNGGDGNQSDGQGGGDWTATPNRFAAFIDAETLPRPNEPPPFPTRLQPHPQERPINEKRQLIEEWRHMVVEDLVRQLRDSLNSYALAQMELQSLQDDVKMNVLKVATVVGLTTNGMARHQGLLTALGARVLVVEEAAEVLEGHILACLTARTQHLILIGDHRQLRPKCEVYELSVESRQGYDLDVSLFERLANNKNYPVATLTTQRRMRPTISRLIRKSIYPNLEDHPQVETYPPVNGMECPLYFLDHDGKEDGEGDEGDGRSKRNQSEVRWVVGLTRYLLQQKGYEPGDIAILTPYVGQLMELRKELQKETMVFVDERDAATMADLEEKEEGGSTDQTSKTTVERGVRRMVKDEGTVVEGTLRSQVRMATIDNFQGEEAKVVIISLVRNNRLGQIGFLRTPNRTNVLLSRAMHGMYIFGNSATLCARRKPPNMWPQILDMLEDSGNLGRSLPLRCDNHPEKVTKINRPEDFRTFVVDGGCSEGCGYRMGCGHTCPRRCHPTDRGHVTVVCPARCMRPRTCKHPCEQICGLPCPPCRERVNVTLPCSHSQSVACCDTSILSTVQCRTRVTLIAPHCTHEATLPCPRAKALRADPTLCVAQCDLALPCGHVCASQCGACFAVTRRESGNKASTTRTHHMQCKSLCGRLHLCGHPCSASCHPNTPCPPCTRNCEVKCAHSKCGKKCRDPCPTCAEQCLWTCPHQGPCPLPCGAPCIRLPCNERCPRSLSCGHRCPSLCGEICPDPDVACPVCAKEKGGKAADWVVDVYLMTSLRDYDQDDPDSSPLVALPCGHCFTVETLDAHLGLAGDQGAYICDPTTGDFTSPAPLPSKHSPPKLCISCRAPIWNVRRYGRFINHAAIQLADRKYLLVAQDKIKIAEEKLEIAQRGVQAIDEDKDGAGVFRLVGDAMKAAEGTVTYCRNPPSKQMHQAAEAALYRHNLDVNLAPPMPDQQPLCRSLLILGRTYTLAVSARASILGRTSRVGGKEEKEGRGELETRLHTAYKEARARLILSLATANSHRCTATLPRILLAQAQLAYVRAEALGVCKRCDGDRVAGQSDGSVMEEGNASTRDSASLDYKVMKAVRLSLIGEGQEHLRQLHGALSGGSEGDMDARAQYVDMARVLDKMLTDLEDKVNRPEVFHQPITSEEKAAVYRAMGHTGSGFTGQGHWFTCPNGHAYVIGDCGGAMERSTCPECGAVIGGDSHRLDATNRQATGFVAEARAGQ